jgi:hypothetical protein
MKLNLRYPPIPENASKFAAIIVDTSRNISKVELDYTPESLKKVDEIIEGFRKEKLNIDNIGTTLFCFGCYVGEVIVRNAGGRWKKREETTMRDVSNMPLLIELHKGGVGNPIGKMIKRFQNGKEDSLVYFYRVCVEGIDQKTK